MPGTGMARALYAQSMVRPCAVRSEHGTLHSPRTWYAPGAVRPIAWYASGRTGSAIPGWMEHWRKFSHLQYFLPNSGYAARYATSFGTDFPQIVTHIWQKAFQTRSGTLADGGFD